MSSSENTSVGRVAWRDLTVPDAEPVRDFYQAVIGWKSEAVDMGGYEDYSMVAPDASADEEPVAGVCHAKGSNADLPAQWLVYFVVANIDESIIQCTERGGQVVAGPRGLGGGRMVVVRDPAGAVCALYQQAG